MTKRGRARRRATGESSIDRYHNGYETSRRMAIESAERLAASLGVEVLPLEAVAPLLPIVPEWLPFMNRRRPR